MPKVMLVILFGALGTIARVGLSVAVERRSGEAFPFGTLTVNLIGCFAAGFLFYVFQVQAPSQSIWRDALLLGFLGAFTTFSALILQSFSLIQKGEIGSAMLYLGVSNAIGLLVLYAGFLLASLMFK